MTSLAESLTSTGLTPPMSGADLKAPDDTAGVKDTAVKQSNSKTSEMSLYQADQGKVEEARADRDALKPPDFPKLAEAPKPETGNDPMRGYVSAIGLLGAIGSMFTRRPMTNAMNAAAATLTAMKQGDEEAFKQKFETWKVENDNAFKLLNYQTDIYDHILQSKNKSVEERMADLGAHAAAFKDDYMMDLSKKQLDLEAADHVLKMREAGEKTQKFSQEIEKLKDENNARRQQKELLDADFKAGTITSQQYQAGLQGIATGKPVTTSPTMSENSIERYARQLNMGDTSVLQNMSRQAGGAANVVAIKERAAELAEEAGISPEEIARRGQEFKAKASGERVLENRAAMITSAGASVGEVPTKDNPGSGAAKLAVDASNAVPRGKYVPLNKAELMVREGTSDPAVAQLVVATNTLVNEYSNAINPTGRGTVSDKTHARELLYKAQSPEAFRAAVTQMVKEKNNALSKVKEATKHYLDDEGEDNKIKPSPAAIDHLKKNHGLRYQFDEKYGEGEADKILGSE